MATSQSMSESMKIKGQTALMCGLCENDPKLKWKCLDCKLMMCQRCREKVHPKFPSAEDHTIIDIKDISKHQGDSGPKPDLTRIKCGVHSGQNCCFYCETCEILVCQICVTKTHNTHKFKDIQDEYEIKLNKIRDEQKNVGKEIHILTFNEQKLKKIKSSQHSNYDKMKQEILDDDKTLKNEIQKHTDKLLKELDQKWAAVSKSIDNKAQELMEQQREMKEQQKEIDRLLHVDNAKDVLSVPGSILKLTKANIQPLKMSIKGVPKFTTGQKTKISQIVGKLDDVTIQMNPDLQLKAKMESKLGCITSVLYCYDGGIWICDRDLNVVQKVRPNGDNLSVFFTIKIEVFDAAVLPSGDLLLSVVQSSNLTLKPSGSTDIQDSVYTVSPLQTLGVHITKDNKIIIGAKERGPPFPVKGQRKVIVMSQTGYKEETFEYDSQNEPLFTLPAVITSNSQGYIAVIDMVSDDQRGRVVVLDKKGGVKKIYTGHPGVNNEDNPFKPTGITTSPSDNFVVADLNTRTLHILNREGEFITFYNTEEMGILLPYSLSFNTTGQLYIGCETYQDSKEKAKLFEIDNFLF